VGRVEVFGKQRADLRGDALGVARQRLAHDFQELPAFLLDRLRIDDAVRLANRENADLQGGQCIVVARRRLAMLQQLRSRFRIRYREIEVDVESGANDVDRVLILDHDHGSSPR